MTVDPVAATERWLGMSSGVLESERKLEQRLRQAAREVLGAGAPAAAVDGWVREALHGPHRPALGKETYMRQLTRDELRRREDEQYYRWKV